MCTTSISVSYDGSLICYMVASYRSMTIPQFLLAGATVNKTPDIILCMIQYNIYDMLYDMQAFWSK